MTMMQRSAQKLSVYEEIALLKEENKQLREIINDLASPDFMPDSVMGELAHFTNGERRVLCVLFKHLNKFVRSNALLNVLYPLDDNPPNPVVIRTYISNIRKKLHHHKIETYTCGGYMLEPLEKVSSSNERRVF